MTFLEGQILGIFSQVMYRHAEIASGGYKYSGRSQGCGKNDDGTIAFRPLTEQECLEDSLSVMRRQIDRLREFTDSLPTEGDDSE